jgi:glycosyltransferase involved in cell wall biosynthesis
VALRERACGRAAPKAGAAKGAGVDLFPIHLLVVLVLLNRYVLGRVVRTVLARDDVDDGYVPRVAIVVPLFNEGEGIYRTVLSLLEQEYPPERLEVVVVDDCSRDDSHAWACKAAEGRPRVKVLRNETNQGKRRSINRAVAATDAEIVVSVDSDVLVDRRAVRELVRRFTREDVAAVGGRTFVENRSRTWLTRMVEVKFHFAQEWLKDLEQASRTVMCLSGCLTAYRRRVLEELRPVLEDRRVAGVPIKYGEDRFLTRQIVKAGYRTRYTPAAFCFTAAPSDISGYFSQQLRWRRSNLVDFLGGVTHAWKLDPLVGVHYVAQRALLVAYPVVILHGILLGEIWEVMALHLGFIALLGVVYRIETRGLPERRRVPALAFLPMAVLMPVSYLVLTPLALFTLDSGSWETRGAAAGAPAMPAAPRSPPSPAPGGAFHAA